MRNYFLVSIILLLIFLIIIAILYNIFINTTIEPFTTTNEFVFPPYNDIDTGIVNIKKYSTFTSNYELSIENMDIPGTDFILSAYSSFSIPNSGQNILSTLKSFASPVTLVPVQTWQNYINFEFYGQLSNYIFKRIEIVLNQSMPENSIFLFTRDFINNKFNQIATKPLSNSLVTKITCEPVNIGKLPCNLVIGFVNLLSEPITINSIRMYFTLPPVQSGTTSEQDKIEIFNDEIADALNVNFPNLIETEELIMQDNNLCKSLNNKFKDILTQNVPWAIYNGGIGDNIECTRDGSKRLSELLKRMCRDAIIYGEYNVTSEDYENIKYTKGTRNTTIVFPENSLPSQYTICSITKYTSDDINLRNNILKSMDDSLLIGHSGNKEGIVYINGANVGSHPSSNTVNKNLIVTCIKSGGINNSKQVIINGELVGTRILGSRVNNGRLIINRNANDKTNCSDFGLAYLIIWDKILSDNELLIVSKVLNNYVKEGINIPIPNNLINMKDGSTIDKAAESAMAIKILTCTNKNGLYWIKPAGTDRASLIFCIMDSNCNGGGWMLAMKGKRNSNTFLYTSLYWTQDNVLIPYNDIHMESTNMFMDTSLDAKYDIYNTFQAKDCLAIFDPREFNSDSPYTDINNRMYGWRWYEENFYDGNKITLLQFNNPNNIKLTTQNNDPYLIKPMRRFKYTCANSGFIDYTKKYINDESQGGQYMEISEFREYIIKRKYLATVWSKQEAYQSYGFNCFTKNISNTWPHITRWGGIFNENGDCIPNTVDVSGGIGLYRISSGDYPTCCISTLGVYRSLSFKWFIR